MRVNDKTVGQFDALVKVSGGRVENASQTIGAVDVQPNAVCVGNRCNFTDAVDDAKVRSAGSGHHGKNRTGVLFEGRFDFGAVQSPALRDRYRDDVDIHHRRCCLQR